MKDMAAFSDRDADGEGGPDVCELEEPCLCEREAAVSLTASS